MSRGVEGRTDITFTLPKADGERAVRALESRREQLEFSQIIYNDLVGKVSLIGAGMRSHPGVTATFCEALAGADINIDIITTSEIRISVLVSDSDLDKAVRALHDAFELGSDEDKLDPAPPTDDTLREAVVVHLLDQHCTGDARHVARRRPHEARHRRPLRPALRRSRESTP